MPNPKKAHSSDNPSDRKETEKKTHTPIRLLSGGYSLLRHKDGLIYRLVLSWVLVSIVSLLTSSGSFMHRSFYRDLSVWKTLLLMAVFMTVLLFVSHQGFLTGLMLGSCTLYCILAVTRNQETFFAIGCCIFLTGVVLFSPAGNLSGRFGTKKLWWTASLLILVYTLWIGGICCLMVLHHDTPNFDFGIFAQMYYYMKKTGLALTTSERNMLLSHFSVHVSPILYLLLPVYLLFPSPLTLQISQCLLTASGLIPLVLLCRRYKISGRASAVFCGIYTFYPAFIGGCLYHFHENNFLTPLILWMFLAFEMDAPICMALTTLLVSLVKEDAPMYAGVIILYFSVRQLSRERSLRAEASHMPTIHGLRHSIRRHALRLVLSLNVWLFLFCVLYFFVCVLYLSEYGQGAMTGRYDNLIYDGTGRISILLSAILENPIYVISQCFTGEKLLSTFQILAPLGFLPLLLTGWEELILLIPYVLMNMMSNYYYQHILGFQYYFGSCAFLFYLSVLHFSRMNGKSLGNGAESPYRRGLTCGKLLLSGLLCCLLLSSSLWQSKLFFYLPDYLNHAQTRENVSEVLQAIPQGAQAAATPYLVPELSQRDEVYDLKYELQDVTDFDYVAIDTRSSTDKDLYTAYSEDPDYQLLKEIPHAAAVFKKTGPQSPEDLFSSGEQEATPEQ